MFSPETPPLNVFMKGLASAMARKTGREALRIKRIRWRSLNFMDMRLLVCNIKSMAANLCETVFFLFIRWMIIGRLAPKIQNSKIGLRKEIMQTFYHLFVFL